MAQHRYQTRHAAAQPLASHRHNDAYVALVDAGAYAEYSADGAYRCVAGMVVMHPAWHLHSNLFSDRQVRVTNVALSSVPRYEVFSLSDARFGYARRIQEPTELLAFVREEGEQVQAWWGSSIVQEIAERLQGDPSQRIDEVAGSLGLSAEHAARQFRRFVGMTPTAYRSEHRFRKAMRLLIDGESAIDVAVTCGYSDQSHLCRTVKAATEITITALQRSDLFNTDAIDHR
jgi:AraC family transcriptional regulator